MVLEILKYRHSLPKKVVFLSMILLWSVGCLSNAANEAKRDFVRIAILPLINQTNNSDLDYYGNGVNLAIIAFESVPDITILPYEQVCTVWKDTYGEQNKITKEKALTFASKYKVEYIVSGSIQGTDNPKLLTIEINIFNVVDCLHSTIVKKTVTEGDLCDLFSELAGKISDYVKKTDLHLKTKQQLLQPPQYLNQKESFVFCCKADMEIEKAFQVNGEQKLMHFRLAEKYAKKAVEAYPTSIQALSNLCFTQIMVDEHSGTRRYDEDIKKHLASAQKECPDDSWIHCLSGIQAWRSGDYNEAIEELHKSLEINPKSYSALNAMGGCFNSMCKYREAVSYLKQAIELNPMGITARLNLAKAFVNFNIDQAITVCDEALACDSDNAEVFYIWAMALREQGHYEKALEMCNKGLDRCVRGTRVDTYSCLLEIAEAVLQSNLGKHNQAISSLRQITSAFPVWPMPHMRLACVIMDKSIKEEGWMDIQLGEEADEAALQAIKVSRGWGNDMKAYAHYIRAMIRIQRGEIYEPIIQLKNAIELDPYIGQQPYELLIMLLIKDDEREQAIKIYQKAKQYQITLSDDVESNVSEHQVDKAK